MIPHQPGERHLEDLNAAELEVLTDRMVWWMMRGALTAATEHGLCTGCAKMPTYAACEAILAKLLVLGHVRLQGYAYDN